MARTRCRVDFYLPPLDREWPRRVPTKPRPFELSRYTAERVAGCIVCWLAENNGGSRVSLGWPRTPPLL
jgi:hypothetical protein